MLDYLKFMFSFWGNLFGNLIPKSSLPNNPPIPSATVIPSVVTQPFVPVVSVVSASSSTFNPENIISEKDFLNCSSMSEQQIQDFLFSKGSFLKDYKINEHLTSYWIYKHSNDLGLNPQILITNIQKEQGSISRKDKPTNQRKLDYICGVGAYDYPRGDDPKWAGVDKQILGAVQVNVKRYNKAKILVFPYAYKTDKPEYRQLNIQNASTMSLYNYTPFVGDQNLIIGGLKYDAPFANLLFWKIYIRWFG